MSAVDLAELIATSIRVPLWAIVLMILLLGYLGGRLFAGLDYSGWREEALWWRRNAMQLLPPEQRAHDDGDAVYGPEEAA